MDLKTVPTTSPYTFLTPGAEREGKQTLGLIPFPVKFFK